MNILAAERSKYERIWGYPGYALHSPGLSHVDMFWGIAKPNPGAALIDIGAGSGAAATELKNRGLNVEAFDLTSAGWNAIDIPLKTGSLWRAVAGNYDYGFCCDVMEHVPEQFAALSIRNILSATRESFFSISFVPDQFGALIGEPLHLTVRPFRWWRDLFREMGNLTDARDLIGEGIFYVKAASQ